MNEGAPISGDQSWVGAPVFVSYATADRKEALSVCKAIERRGLNCWISTRDVAPGENYQEAIVRSLRGSRAMVLVFSEAANNSGEIKKELSLASRYHIPVMALRIEDVEPSDAFAYELSTRQWIDAFTGWERAIDVLVRELAGRSASASASRGISTDAGKRGRPRITRRQAMLAGSATIVLAGAPTWFEIDRKRLPSRAQTLLDEGHSAMNEGTVDQFAAAAERFKQAAQIAPEHAEPWGALALAYERAALLSPMAQQRALNIRSAEARRRALAIDPRNGDALAAAAFSMPMFGNWAAVERVCRHGLERQPNHPVLNGYLGVVLSQVGRTSEALLHMTKAVEANPKFIEATIFRVLLLEDLNRLDEASTAIEGAFQSWPRQYGVWFIRLYHLTYYGKPAEALAMIDDRTARPIGIPEWNFEISRAQINAIATQKATDIDRAMKLTLETVTKGTGFAENAIGFAGALGRVDDAFKAIDGYFFDKGFQLPEVRFADEQGVYTTRRNRDTLPLLRRFMRPVQLDARFDPLLSAVRLKDYWSSTGTTPEYLSWLRTG